MISEEEKKEPWIWGVVLVRKQKETRGFGCSMKEKGYKLGLTDEMSKEWEF